MSKIKLEQETACRIGEGVIWSVAEQAVYWTDILGDVLYRQHQGTLKSWQFDRGLTSIGFAEGGMLVGTFVDGLYELDLINGDHKKICSPDVDYSKIRFNDGAVDTFGHYWAGTMHKDDPVGNPVGKLYRFSTQGESSVQDQDYHVPNGPCFSADGKIMYHTDTLVAQTVYRCELDNLGNLLKRSVFIRLDEKDVYPDGMCLDIEGNLWVALWGGWGINQYAPDGRLIQHVKLPVAQVTKCVFGGVAMDTLYITTASEYLPEADLISQPQAGSLFSFKTDTHGLSEHLFK